MSHTRTWRDCGHGVDRSVHVCLFLPQWERRGDTLAIFCQPSACRCHSVCLYVRDELCALLVVRMRVSKESERIGLDRSQHAEEYGSEAAGTEIAEEIPSEAEWLKSVSEN